jgi:hypothetical protein
VLSLPQNMSVLVVTPLDAMLSPLTAATAHDAYQFAARIGGGRLTVKPEVAPQDVLATISAWFSAAGSH